MTRKILGTNKFVIYMYNGKNIRGKSIPKPKHFSYRQWGQIFIYDENGKYVSNRGFTNYGQMVSIINKIMVTSVRKNLKSHKTWD